MGKITVNNLVSLILNEINSQQAFPSNQFTFIGNRQDLSQYLQVVEAPAEGGEHQNEMGEMAQKREYESEKLPQVMKIPVEELSLGPKGQLPPIRCLDPESGEYVDNVVIGDTVLTTPTGLRFLIFENFVGRTKVDMAGKKEEFYVQIPENKFLKFKPRGSVYGKEVPRNVSQKLSVAPPDELEPDRIAREKRLAAIKEANAKRYGIFPIINDVFSNPRILDHLDICLIPETWATSVRTEHPTNKILLKKFGGNTSDIDADFIAVRDMKNVDEAITNVMDLRAELAMGADDPNNPRPDRQREFSQHMPRQHAAAIYHNGNWHAKQRVHDPEFFRKAGGKTPVYELLSKNIQEGLATVNIKSVLHITGNIQNNTEYLIKATFSSQLNARNLERGSGEEIGDLFPPITVGLRKPLPEDADPAAFTLEQNTSFFVDQGRTTKAGEKTGYFPTLMKSLALEIKNQIDPDAVLERMIQLIQNAVDVNPDAAA